MNQIILIDENLGVIMGQVLLINLTSFIVKWLREVKVCKIIVIFFFNEHLGAIMIRF